MLKRIAVLIPLLLLLFSSMAWGEGQPIRITKLEVQIMPEFIAPEGWPKDTPCLLTGMYGVIMNAGTTAYDGEISIQIPKAVATSVHLVGEFKDQQSGETSLKYELKADQGLIVWKPDKPIEANKPYYFVVEYYSNPFTIQDKEHRFDYALHSLYDIDNIQMYVYKPTDSISMQLSEPAQSTSPNELGQEVSQISVGALKSGSEHKLTVKYLKENLETVMEKHSKTAQKTPDGAASPEAGTAGAGSTDSSVESGNTAAPAPDASKDSWIIGGAIVIFGLLVFMGLRSYQAPQRLSKETAAAPSSHRREEIRALRRELVEEELTEGEYLIERKKRI